MVYVEFRHMASGETPGDRSVLQVTQVAGTLAGYRSDSQTAVIELTDGRTIETAGAKQLEGYLKVGDPAVVYFDRDQRVIGFLLPNANVGVNLRHSEAT
jgi:hypothetical protein